MEIRNAKTQDVDDILEIINFQILNSTAVYDCKKKTYLQQLKWYEKKNSRWNARNCCRI